MRDAALTPEIPSTKTITIVLEQTASGWGAYVPSLAGSCVAAADTYDACLRLILDSIRLHLDAARECGVAP